MSKPKSEEDWANFIEVAPSFKAVVGQLSEETGVGFCELIESAVGLLVIALRAKKQGHRIVICEEITGLPELKIK